MTLERCAWRDEGARQRVAIAPGYVGADEPELRLAGIATRRKRVVHEFAVAHRHFGAGLEIRARPNDDHRGAAVLIVDDGSGGLDYRAARGPHHRGLLRLPLGRGVGRTGRKYG